MKRLLMTMSLFTLIVVLAACGGSNGENSGNSSDGSDSASSDKVYELNLNVSAAPNSPFNENVAMPWAEYVEEQTDGVVQVNVFPAAALGELNTSFNDISGGIYEAGLVPPGPQEDTDLFPLTISTIPFLLTSPQMAQNVLTDFVEEFLAEEVFTDATFLSVSSTDAFQLYGDIPVSSPEDVKNKKVSDTDLRRVDLYKRIGAVPVTLANTELYESLERGITDFVSYTAVGANGYKFEEVTDYMTKLDMGVGVLPFMINTEFLESLPEEIQTQFIEDFGPRYADLTTELYTTSAEEAVAIYESNVEGKNGGIYEPTEDELAAFKAPVKEQIDEWIEEANKRGYDGQEMMDYYLERLENEGVVLP